MGKGVEAIDGKHVPLDLTADEAIVTWSLSAIAGLRFRVARHDMYRQHQRTHAETDWDLHPQENHATAWIHTCTKSKTDPSVDRRCTRWEG